jgi:succinylglutamate desuccinylase
MRVEYLGEGDPEVAVVGSVHGDEPCGAHAVERLLADPPDVERPVKLVVANEEALDRGVRYVDEDLNRAFPGAPDADTHEGRLAHALLRELEGCTTFSIHSTQSYDRPFAVVDGVDALAESVCPYLSVEAVVDAGPFTEGRLVEYAEVVEVEAGLQGSPAAAANAVDLAHEFLAAVGALPRPTERRRDLPVYRLARRIPKPPADSYAVLVANFERVDEGQAYATVDGEELRADGPFYPVLMSAYGYENDLGYAADLVSRLG